MQCEKCNVEMTKGFIAGSGYWLEGQQPEIEFNRKMQGLFMNRDAYFPDTWLCKSCGVMKMNMPAKNLEKINS